MKTNGLIIKNVSKSFNGVQVIKNVTAYFMPGKVSALIGPNGAGKTTLFHIIAGELKPDSGKVIYNGEDITNLPPWKRAQKGIGRLFQDVRIFKNMTALENVMCAFFHPRHETIRFSLSKNKKRKILNVQEKAQELLNVVRLSKYAEKKAGELSFGQQKLLAIARLLALKPRMLLLDEPTAGLSPVMRKEILGILKMIAKEERKIIVIVEHNISVLLDIAHWVYFMNEGEISFFGRVDHVLGSKQVREIYLGISA